MARILVVFGAILLFLISLSSFALGAVVYVKWDSPGPILDGKSWDTAFHSIQDGVNAAGFGYEVWVARGVYTGYVSMKNNVGLYGGFACNETSKDQRIVVDANRTIIDGRDTGFQVIYGANGAKIDGFSIVRGHIAVYCRGRTEVSHCRLISNSWGVVDYYGGSVITNNLIASNEYGGIHPFAASTTIIGNTIVGNGYGVMADGFGTPVSVVIANNIISYNSRGVGVSRSAVAALTTNCVHANNTDYYGVSGGTSDISADPMFMCYAYGDLHIRPESPCRDRGSAAVPNIPQLDMDGQARIQNGDIDIGADESDGSSWEVTPRRIYVKQNASTPGDGRSWATAYPSIQMATTDASLYGGADIWVASGTYTGRVDSTSFCHLYGGFNESENTEGERSLSGNPTVIDLESNSIFLMAASSIDGFQIVNGYKGVYCFLRQTAVRNCMISNCDFAIVGYIGECSITNNVIDNNTSGISCSGPHFEIVGNILSNNSNALYMSEAVAAVMNNTIVSNSGYAITSSYGTVTLTNNIVAFNGAGIRTWRGVPYRPKDNDVFGNELFDTDFAPGPGDISLDPLFADLASGNYHLSPYSPCIDAGTNEGAPATDFDGIARPVDGDCDGVPVTDIGAFEYVPIHVEIDVLPGQSPNHIVPQPNKLILVAILGSASFDVSQVDALSVVFGPGRATEVHGKGHMEDVNFDGFTDMLLHFRCGETGILAGTSTVHLYGRLTNGERMEGSDSLTAYAK